LLEQQLDPEQVVAFAAGEVQRHRPALGVGAQVQLARKATARAPERLLAGGLPCPGSMGVGTDHAAVEQVYGPARLRCHGAQLGDDAAPDLGGGPALQATPRGAPAHQLGGEVAPGGAGAGQPKHGLEEPAVVDGGTSGPGLLGWQQRREAGPQRLAQHGSDRHPAQVRSNHPSANPFGDTL